MNSDFSPLKTPNQSALLPIYKTSLLLLLIVLSAGFSSFRLFQADEKDFGNMLVMDDVTLREIFTLEKGNKYTVLFTNDVKKDLAMEAVVVSHLNQSPNSGVMRLDLQYGSLKFKLLLNRKMLIGGLQYQVNLIQEGGKITYRFLRKDEKFVTLERTLLSKIVTE